MRNHLGLRRRRHAFHVLFAPAQEGERTADLTVQTSVADDGTATASLTGTGTT